MIRYVRKIRMNAVLGHRLSDFILKLLVATRRARELCGAYYIYVNPAEYQGG